MMSANISSSMRPATTPSSSALSTVELVNWTLA